MLSIEKPLYDGNVIITSRMKTSFQFDMKYSIMSGTFDRVIIRHTRSCFHIMEI